MLRARSGASILHCDRDALHAAARPFTTVQKSVSAVTRCVRCASYAAITRETPTYSISPIGFHRLIQRLGEAAKMPFPIHPHMLRHACGFKLANDGHDTRALQHYLGHKNIQHTVRYTEMAPDRFKDFWRD